MLLIIALHVLESGMNQNHPENLLIWSQGTDSVGLQEVPREGDAAGSESILWELLSLWNKDQLKDYFDFVNIKD